MELAVDVSAQQRCGVVRVAGELDLSTSAPLAARLRLVASEWDGVVVDLTDVTFVDSTGLGVLVVAHDELRRKGGRLAVVCTHRLARRLLAVTALDTLFPVRDDLKAALEDVRKR